MQRSRVYGALLRERLIAGVPINWILIYGMVGWTLISQLHQWRLIFVVLIVHVVATWICKRDARMFDMYMSYASLPQRFHPTLWPGVRVRRPRWMGGRRAT